MINEIQFEEWWDKQIWYLTTDGYEMAESAWQEQQKKIDELQMAFEDCCIRKLSADQHIERQQKKIDELEAEKKAGNNAR